MILTGRDEDVEKIIIKYEIASLRTEIWLTKENLWLRKLGRK